MTDPGVHLVLQAGGKGERIGSDLPKPLVRIAGTAIAERLLRQGLKAGIRRATVITGWRGGEVEAHFRALGDLPPDLELDFVSEKEPRGNAGALAHFAAQDRPILLCFADLVTDLDFGRLAERHRAGGGAITLCSHEEAHRVRLGELVADGERVTSYLEKPVKRILICSGIGLFEPAALGVIDPDAATGLADLVNRALAAGFAVEHWRHGALWIDVNTAEDVAAAEALFAP